ncbi:MAG TPA: pyridoxal phosphate-dependent aminotransferase family protein [Bacteroidales bacterium]|nr:pyridoxal phosphate-dependent aminotransferase family protein [Bacteroidales bacterium]HPS50886.1 pyridoxal phosphate-dependent aminotransferase family protein [Bacteroidales bacterium]
MRVLQRKLAHYTEPQKVEKLGIYPFFRMIESDQDTVVTMNGKQVLMFGSNSYMGLTNHPRIKEAAIEATRKYGTGCAGSRFLNGTLDIHIELEKKLAEFVGKQAALVYSTGFQVNLGVIPTVTGRNDYILIDELDHASIIEATRLSFAKVMKFRHNDMQSLERLLKRCETARIKLIVVDGVFSMDGDIANLPEIVRLADKYEATIMIDDAHAIGVIGKNGSGTASHFGLTRKVDLIMGTFSKSLAALGGFIASDFETINFIKHHSRSLIFSASMTPASAAAVLTAIEIIKSEPERMQHLWDITRYTIEQFKKLGFDLGNTVTPIIPLYIRDNLKTLTLTRLLLDEGIFVNPVVAPAVSKDNTLIRFSLMATHTKDQIDIALDKFEKLGKKLHIIS